MSDLTPDDRAVVAAVEEGMGEALEAAILPPAANGNTAGALRLDLACGESVREGYAGVDLFALPGVSYTADLNETPFHLTPVGERHGELAELHAQAFTPDAGSVAAIFTSHFVEHVRDLVGFVNECYRILEPDGQLVIRYPYQFSIGAWQDPTHIRAVNEATWLYFDSRFRNVNRLGHYLGVTADFQVIETVPTSVNPEYQDANPETFQRAVRKFVNVVHEMQTTMVKV